MFDQDRERPEPRPFPAGDLVRRLRRHLDLSQRELAAEAGISPATVARIESGSQAPTLQTLIDLLALASWELVAATGDGHRVTPLVEYDGDLRDGAGRRFPAHLDVILEPRYGQWWGHLYGLAAPPETFRKSRARRDWERANSQFSVGRRSPR